MPAMGTPILKASGTQDVGDLKLRPPHPLTRLGVQLTGTDTFA